jgi:DNA mismatch endonuclease (patch repair protein)
MPKSNINFWKIKIQANIDRDKKVKKELRKTGWTVITIWECELKNNKVFNQTMKKLTNKFRN